MAEKRTDSSLDMLIEYYEYFESGDLKERLIEWVSEELGIRKALARLIINKVAPWILGRARQAGIKIGSAWMERLHTHFAAKFAPYRWITTDVLNVILVKLKADKNRSELLLERKRQISAAISDPSIAKELLDDSSLWEKLDENQKGLVALRAGQGAMDEQIKAIRMILKPSLPVKLYYESQTGEDKASIAWLVFRRRKAGLVARNAELESLDKFYFKNMPFSWWCITGPGGIGKSRLVLDSLLENVPSYWRKGFISNEVLADFDFQNWEPEEPTIMVIDYAAVNPKRISFLIGHLIHSSEKFEFPIRLLLLERQLDTNNWWDEVICKGKADFIDRQAALHMGKHLALIRLNRPHQKEAFISFLLKAGDFDLSTLPSDEDPFWDTLDELSDNGLPLLVGMVALSVAQKGINGYASWDRKELFQYLYDREMANWRQICQDDNLQSVVTNIVSVATACHGLDLIQQEQNILENLNANNLISASISEEHLWESVFQVTGGNERYMLEPDLLGEFFLLRKLDRPKHAGLIRRVRNTLKCAWDLDSVNTYNTIARIIKDFPDETVPIWWISLMQALPQKDTAFPGLYANLYAEAILAASKNDNLESVESILSELKKLFESSLSQAFVPLGIARTASVAMEFYGRQKRWKELWETFNMIVEVEKANPGDWFIVPILGDAASLLTIALADGQRWNDLARALKILVDYTKYALPLCNRRQYDPEKQMGQKVITAVGRGMVCAAWELIRAGKIDDASYLCKWLIDIVAHTEPWPELEASYAACLFYSMVCAFDKGRIEDARRNFKDLKAVAEKFPSDELIQESLKEAEDLWSYMQVQDDSGDSSD